MSNGRTASVRSVEIGVQPFSPAHAAALCEIASDPVAGMTWRTRGRPIAPDDLTKMLLTDSLSCFTVFDRKGVGGVAQVFGYDPVDQTAQLSVLLRADLWATSALGSCLRPLVSASISAAPVRRLYAMMASSVSDRVASSLRTLGLSATGRLPDQLYVDGHYEDLVFWSFDSAALDRLANGVGVPDALGSVPLSTVEARQTIVELIGDLASVDHVGPETELAQLDLDSLAWLVVVDTLDRICSEPIEFQDLPALGTIGDVCQLMEDRF